MTAKKILVTMVMLLLATPALGGTWHFKSLHSPNRNNHGAIVTYKTDHPEGVRLAFKCGYGERLHLILGVYLPIYKGMDRRHRVLIKVGPDERYRFKLREVVRSGIAADQFYAGLAAEVHKLWFMSRQAIAFRTYGGLSEPRFHEILRALRDGDGEAEIHIGKKIAKISLSGSAHALDEFSRACNFHIDD